MLSLIWFSYDKGMAIPIKKSDVVIEEWPVFEELAAESRCARDLRWQRTFKELATRQHAFVRNHAIAAYLDSNQCRTNLPHRMNLMMSMLAQHHIQASFAITEHVAKFRYVGLSVTYSLGSAQHSLHISNLSPSEYERNT